MPLLIDGYNLLYVSGIVGRGGGPGGLHRSRVALLNFLAESLDAGELSRTTVVFDAHDAPWGLPRSLEHRGITVRFAAQYQEADDLIEELIQADSSPRRLVVVSSDHRIQRAARRRRAKVVDSDVWYAEVVRLRRDRPQSRTEMPVRPAVPLLEEDVEYWIRQFGGESALTAFLMQEIAGNEASAPPSTDQPAEKSLSEDEAEKIPLCDLDNPFPPGYGEDLLDQDP